LPRRSDSPPPPDRFESVYAAGIGGPIPEDPVLRERERLAGTARAEPGEPFALRGIVLTPEDRIDDGHVVVEGADIAAVGEGAPEGVRTIDTEGVIMPGLIDLHGHPEYNVFAAWEPPRSYANRYAWRRSKEYKAVVREPWKLLTEKKEGRPSLLKTLTRYAEARALVGGATAIQGASGKYPDKHEALVRNVDLRIFGQHKARSIIDLSREDVEDRSRSARRSTRAR
jgi:hypothetical protein